MMKAARCWPSIAAMALAVVLVGCGGDDSSGGTTTSSSQDTSTTEATTSSVTSTGSTTTTGSSATTSSSTSSSATSATSTTTPSLEQPAIWPAPGVVFDTPEAAAADFVSQVFGFAPNLGEFQQGDARSGEIEVRSPAESGGAAIRSVLLLRQLGPDDGWFVLAAVNGNNTITTPAARSEVEAGTVEVAGQGRGFEGLLIIEAFTAGDGTRLDQQQAQGGSTEATEPYSVSLDLSGASSGDTVLLLVRGGVGLETDTGEFSAIGVVIG